MSRQRSIQRWMQRKAQSKRPADPVLLIPDEMAKGLADAILKEASDGIQDKNIHRL